MPDPLAASALLAAADPSPWLQVFGRTHPVLLHAPLGLLPGVALLEFGAALLRRPIPRGSVQALAWLAALSAAAAAAAGLVLAGEGGYADGLLGWHKLTGLGFAGVALLAALLSGLAGRWPFRLVLLVALAAMLPAGHLGAGLTHGEDFLLAPLHQRAKTAATGGGAGGSRAAAAASQFAREIAPILERSCTKCHNPEKHKGELDLSTAAGVQQGGENGAVLVAGNAANSKLLRVCRLPEDDDNVMPPKGKSPRPTAQELEAIERWIAAGAKFD